VTTTPLLEFLKRKREERKQTQQRRNKGSRNAGSNMNEDDYNSSQRYKVGDRSKYDFYFEIKV